MKPLRIVPSLLLSAALIVTFGSVASAHECFNASRSAQANSVIAQHSHGWFDIQTSQIAAILVVSCLQTPGPDCPPPPPSLSPGEINDLKTGGFEFLVGQILGFVPTGPAVNDLLAFTSRVATEAACLGVPTHYLTLANATAAGGAGGKSVTTDGKGIDHFPDVYGQQIGAAYATVLSGGPSACH